MNQKIIGKTLAFLLLLEALFLLPPAVIAFVDGTHDAFNGIVWTIVIAVLAGLVMWFICRDADRSFYAREGFLITGLGWMLLSAVGALPFYISGEIPSYVDALFETVSGLTTTGSSVLSDVESMSRGLLFWRSFTHWLGGMGVLVFLLAIVPMGRGGGYSIHVLRAESPGPSVGKLVPRIRRTAGILYAIYIALTALCAIFLVCGEMNWFEALCHAFGTAGTGGFGIKNDSLAGYSRYSQTVCIVFMTMFGINFAMYFLVLLRKFRQILRNEELWTYLLIMLSATAIIATNIRSMFPSTGDAVHHAAFAVSSVLTTTGYGTEDFNLWPQLSRTILVVLMFIGGCAGGTGGGMKVARIVLIYKALAARVKQMLHPRSVTLVRFDSHTVSDDTLQGLSTYLYAYCAIAVLSILIISLDGFSFETNVTSVISCLNNIGPGLDAVGPAANYAAFGVLSKFVLMLNMLLGRLEIFPLLIMLSPKVWRRAD